MASSLNGRIRVFVDNAYTTQLDTIADSTILDGDGWTYSATAKLGFVDYDWSTNGGLTGNVLLDIDDGEDYCLDEIEFPVPRPRIEWRDPSHGDGRDVSFYKWENRQVKIRMNVFGTDEADLAAHIEALWEFFLAENPILEWKSDGWSDPLYIDLISPPLEINTPDWFESVTRENGKIMMLSNLELILEAKPFLRGPEETVVLLNGAVASPDVVNGVSGIVVPPASFKGDVPAPADIFIDLVDGTLWTDLIFGQRLKYSASFDPIQEPTVGTVHANLNRLSDDYYSIPAAPNLLLNPHFDTVTAGSGDTTDWANWAESRTYGHMGYETVKIYGGIYSVKVGGVASTECLLASDATAIDPTKTYIFSVQMASSVGGLTLASQAIAAFYDGAVLVGTKYLWVETSIPTEWTKYQVYIYPSDFPAGTDNLKLNLRCVSYGSPIGYHYWDAAVLSEISNVIQVEFPLDSHEGRYLPVGAISFEAGTNVHDDVTFQAMLATIAGVEITPSINPMTIDPLDPVTKFVDVAMLNPRVPIISIPTHRISGLADKSDIEQIIRVSTDPSNVKIFWYDYVGIVPIDRAYSEVRTWSGNPHLILDGRSSQLALTSLTGTLDDAQTWSIAKQKGNASFVADPDGFNGAIVAVTNVAGDYQVLSTVDITMVYSPLYLLVPEG